MSRSLRQKRKIAARYHQWVVRIKLDGVDTWVVVHDLPCGCFTGDCYFSGTKKECIEVAFANRFAMFDDQTITITYGEADAT